MSYKEKRFTEEQLQRAGNIDIADMLLRQGEKLKKEGRVKSRVCQKNSTDKFGFFNLLCEN